MSTTTVTRVVEICNEQGLHARPAELFARQAMRFESQVEIVSGSQRVDGKSILHLLTLGAGQGTQLVIEAEGPDAQAAVDALAALVERGFVADEAPQQ